MKGDRHRLNPWTTLGLGGFLVVVFGPLLSLMASVIVELSQGNGAWLSLLVPTGRRWQLLGNSLQLAIAVGTVSTVLGGLIACYLWQTAWAWRWRWGLLPLLFVPSYIHSFGWSALGLGLNGGLRSLGFGTIPLQGWWSCGWVEVMAFLPLAVGLGWLGLAAVGREAIEAARLLVPDLQVLGQIILPLALPSFVASFGLIFLLSLMDYSLPSLFGIGTYALEIFAEYSTSNEPARAFLLAVPLLAIAWGVILILQLPLQQTMQLSPQENLWEIPPRWPWWFVWLQHLALGLFTLQILVPFVNLLVMAAQESQWFPPIQATAREITFTLGLGLTVAIAALPLALAIAQLLNRDDRWGRVTWGLVIWALALPAPLVGIGLIDLWNRPLPLEIYGTPLMPFLAHLARFTPFASLVLLAQLQQLNQPLWEATRLEVGPRWRIWLWLRLPLLLPGLLAAAGLVFALSVGELGATLIVIPPGYSTLTLRIYNYLHYGAAASVAVLCLVLVAIAFGVGGLMAWGLRGWGTIYRGGDRP
ncbi:MULTISPECIES: iron ABC transporter permease [Cyanophyceae]|uniref:ABC transporter permease n=1 Tax=Cyanophyceae TaxID=3028117 RepID=UPI000A0F3CAA|nr:MULTISPECIES: ABC transporter permease subunit [Cyanophyceae]SMH48194.1 iron(III) transport system permease protein [Picosynechococcus sp. OG1]SMQ81229.1 iron(III) transport system permease protein [Synechococcus sp. 7002]